MYQSHDMTYAGDLIECGYCGRPITGEQKTKKTKAGAKEYVYYRCSRYNAKDHPRIRLTERELDEQVLELFDRIRIEDEKVRSWFHRVLRERTRQTQEENRERSGQLKRQLALVEQQKDRLLNLRLMEEIRAETFAAKNTDLRDRAAQIRLQLEACDRGRDENAGIVVKAFELSRVLREKYVNAEPVAKRHILEIVCLNFTLQDATLVPTIGKPFDVLAEGLVLSNGRGDWI